MNKLFVQLFCRHVYKSINKIYLRKEEKYMGSDSLGYFPEWKIITYYYQTEICLKCNKTYSHVIEDE